MFRDGAEGAPVAEPSDEALMHQVQGGDRAAYEALYARHRDRVFAFLCRRTGARTEAEDAHQETWLRVYRFRHRYDVARPFRPWLYTLAANAGRDARRPDLPLFQLPAVQGQDPALRDRVVIALHGLSPLDRRILLLTVEGFTSAEVGAIVGLAATAVRARLSRARRAIREGTDA